VNATSEEQQLSPSWDGSVVLDIGGDIGALVLAVPARLDREEIDLHPDDAGQPNTHSAVRERRLQSGSNYAAVYPALREGGYTIVGTAQRVTIVGGAVTQIRVEAETEHDLASHLAQVHGEHVHSHEHGRHEHGTARHSHP
jgi:hypothetical protein